MIIVWNQHCLGKCGQCQFLGPHLDLSNQKVTEDANIFVFLISYFVLLC